MKRQGNVEEGMSVYDSRYPRSDRESVSIFCSEDIDRWCKSLRCQPGDLYAAVVTVGSNAEQVRKYLATHQHLGGHGLEGAIA